MELQAKKVILFLTIFLISLSFASAQAPIIQDVKLIEGYEIKYPQNGILKQNEPYTFFFHVFNKSNGMPVGATDANCSFHLYNETGEHTIDFGNIFNDGEHGVINEWEILVTGGNFTTLGGYSYIVQCNSSSFGGYENVGFEVTPLGLSQTTSQGIGSASFLILMIVLMFVFGFIGSKMLKTENWWILGIFLMFLSSLFLVYNTWLGYEYHRLFTGLSNNAMPETIFWIFLLLIAAGVLASVILLFRHWKRVIRYIKKEMKRKDREDKNVEDWDLEDMTGEVWGPPRSLR